jgi:hypothetical protein
MKNVTTIREIAKAQGLNPVYVAALARSKGFPMPVEIVGVQRFYSRRAIETFFAVRYWTADCRFKSTLHR